ncbi:MAG: carbon-nitrogen hydrolase family protein [Erysipelotrichaceae bacterium]|nr:carbon-nitrogen hydrolase family protein [Erysipelotrichaceae bacterium]
MNRLKAALIQMPVVEDKQTNLEVAGDYIRQAADQGADLVVLPEMFNCPYASVNFPVYAEAEGGASHAYLSEAARDNSVYLVAGSIPERDAQGRIFNTSFVFDRAGRQIGRHRKMHLFDIEVEGGQCFKESDTLAPGQEVTVFETEFGKIGLAICYDLRFPELARLMTDDGAKILVIPAAFNMTTGPAHWEVLFRNRALDNQVYILGVAPARNPNGVYVSYGNSLVVSPWGDVVSRLDDQPGMLVTEIDLDYVDKVRRELPLLQHRRKDLYTLSKRF